MQAEPLTGGRYKQNVTGMRTFLPGNCLLQRTHLFPVLRIESQPEGADVNGERHNSMCKTKTKKGTSRR